MIRTKAIVPYIVGVNLKNTSPTYVSDDDYPPSSSSSTGMGTNLDAVISGGDRHGRVRQEVLDSWMVSLGFGCNPHVFEPPSEDVVSVSPMLSRAAIPVLARLATDLETAAIAIALVNEDCQVVERRFGSMMDQKLLDGLALSPGRSWARQYIGTNALGDACVTGAPIFIDGDEHFSVALIGMASAGAPIHDPRSGSIVGALALVCRSELANPLMLTVACQAVRDIESRLTRQWTSVECDLEARFMSARRRTRGGVALVSSVNLFTNAAASRFFAESTQPQLWEFASKALLSRGSTNTIFRFCDGMDVHVTLEPVFDERELVGVIIRLPLASSRDRALNSPVGSVTSPNPCESYSTRLTEAERAVAELVVKGLTNREAATQLYLSPHTVDSHLRHIYWKFGINSRVQLARTIGS